MNIYKQILIILAVVIAMLVIIAGTSYISDKQKSKNASEAFRSEYVKGCIEEANYAFCNCSYDELVNDLGLDGFMQMSVEFTKTEILPKEAYKAIMKCADKLI